MAAIAENGPLGAGPCLRHEERFLRPGLSAGFGSRKETITGMCRLSARCADRNSASMEITQQVRDYAASHGSDVQAAVETGMAEQPVEFRKATVRSTCRPSAKG